MLLTPGSRIGSYEIVSALGAGGMGEIYRARDSTLQRDVAIKVLTELRAWDKKAIARFEHEALVLAALSHPNVLTIFELGKQDGITFLVTELLAGRTLRQRLEAGPLPTEEAVELALQIARGLAAAHQKGIVHRDLKPENIIISEEGHLKILDFGLAKRGVLASGSDDSGPLAPRPVTESGMIVGTVGYMAPEQVRGFVVDQRSDLFSFGLIFYEMLSGKRAFERETPVDTMAAILSDEPPPLSGTSPAVPPELEGVVRRCLEKKPEKRFESASEIASTLHRSASGSLSSEPRTPAVPRRRARRFLLPAAVLSVAALGVLLLWTFAQNPRGSGGPRRIAVLPFENLGAAEDAYVADGIADAVRGKLTSLGGIEVIARASSTPYLKTKKSPAEIAGELGVRYLLTGTVRWQKAPGRSRLQVSPELVEVEGKSAPRSRWQRSFDVSFTDLFEVQSDIATRVAQSLGVALGAGDERRLSEQPTQNMAAYDAFLKGEGWAAAGMGALDPASVERAIGFYEQAVSLDPGFARAWAQLSRASSFLCSTNGTRATPLFAARARQASERALALAPGSLETQMASGQYQLGVLLDFDKALEGFVAAQRISPGNADVLGAIGWTEAHLGHWQPAIGHLRNAERLDPRSVLIPRRLGYALFCLRRYPEARATFERGLALAPGNLSLFVNRAATFLGEGKIDAARASVARVPVEIEQTVWLANVGRYLPFLLDDRQRTLVMALSPSAFGEDRGAWGLCLAQIATTRGDAASARRYAEEARKAFEEQIRMDALGLTTAHSSLGLALALLGRKAEAVREGERGVALPLASNALDGPILQNLLVRIYILADEPEKAIDRIEGLLKVPYTISPGWLRIEPVFDPLRGNPRFEKLARGE